MFEYKEGDEVEGLSAPQTETLFCPVNSLLIVQHWNRKLRKQNFVGFQRDREMDASVGIRWYGSWQKATVAGTASD